MTNLTIGESSLRVNVGVLSALGSPKLYVFFLRSVKAMLQEIDPSVVCTRTDVEWAGEEWAVKNFIRPVRYRWEY